MVKKNSKYCGICGKLAFPSESYAGHDDWYECRNPKCPMHGGKWRLFEK